MKRLIPTTVALLGAATMAYAGGAMEGGEERDIVVASRQYAFDPPRIHVNRGDIVRLIIHSEDVVHGFYLEGHDINETIVPQVEPTVVVFRANKRGKFRYRCSNTCGTMHPFMTGELIVGPNTPLHAGLGGLVGLTLGMGLLFAFGREKDA